MKSVLLFSMLLLCATSFADRAEVGKPFPPYTLTDQFGTTNTFSPETRWVIIASEKSVSGKVNDWLKTKPADYLGSHAAEYVSDIEPMPGVITSLFALPKMKKYPFRLLLATEKSFAQTYPSEKGKIALFILDEDQKIQAIRYVDEAAEIEAALTASAER